jgi:hypothetical protein
VLESAFVTSCEDAHRCTKEQDCPTFFGSSMQFGISFMLTMHPSNVGSGAHFDKVFSKMTYFYLQI